MSPGPWKVGARYGDLKTEVNDAEGNAVATVWTHKHARGTHEEIRGQVVDPEGMANAKAIALLPELLSLLERYVANDATEERTNNDLYESARECVIAAGGEP